MIAASTTKSGRKLLILGLDDVNMRRLRDDRPIYKDLSQEPQDVPGLEEWDITILGPEDTARFVATFGAEPASLSALVTLVGGPGGQRTWARERREVGDRIVVDRDPAGRRMRPAAYVISNREDPRRPGNLLAFYAGLADDDEGGGMEDEEFDPEQIREGGGRIAPVDVPDEIEESLRREREGEDEDDQ